MRRRKDVLRRVALGAVALVVAAGAAAAWLWATLPDPAPLATHNPRTTALIEQRIAEARARRRPYHPRQLWVPLERISPKLVQAVLYSEDANFFGHEGIDWEAMRDAAEHDIKVGRYARGASTLTQQLAKNLWLGTEKSLWRKAKEAVLAAKLERAVSKRRILALYLNVVEMDEGVFGAEAGARHRFGTSAASLTTAQAAALASMLPAPRRVDLARPSAWFKKRSRALLDRLRDHGRISTDEHLRASAELERILAGPAPADDREEPPEDEAPPPAPARAASHDEPPPAAPVQAPVEITAEPPAAHADGGAAGETRPASGQAEQPAPPASPTAAAQAGAAR